MSALNGESGQVLGDGRLPKSERRETHRSDVFLPIEVLKREGAIHMTRIPVKRGDKISSVPEDEIQEREKPGSPCRARSRAIGSTNPSTAAFELP